MNISETIKALPDDAECCVLRYGSDRIEAFADVPDLKRLIDALEKCETAIEAGKQELTAERDELKVRLTEAEYVISGMHHLGTSTAAVNASTALNAYLENYGMKKPLPESYTEDE